MRRHARSGSFTCSCIQAGVQGIIMDTAQRRRRERKNVQPTQEVPFPVVLEQQFHRGHATATMCWKYPGRNWRKKAKQKQKSGNRSVKSGSCNFTVFVSLLSRIGWHGKSAFGLQNFQNPWKGDSVVLLKNSEDIDPLPGCSSSTTETESRNPLKIMHLKTKHNLFLYNAFFYLEQQKLALFLCL